MCLPKSDVALFVMEGRENDEPIQNNCHMICYVIKVPCIQYCRTSTFYLIYLWDLAKVIVLAVFEVPSLRRGELN